MPWWGMKMACLEVNCTMFPGLGQSWPPQKPGDQFIIIHVIFSSTSISENSYLGPHTLPHTSTKLNLLRWAFPPLICWKQNCITWIKIREQISLMPNHDKVFNRQALLLESWKWHGHHPVLRGILILFRGISGKNTFNDFNFTQNPIVELIEILDLMINFF